MDKIDILPNSHYTQDYVFSDLIEQAEYSDCVVFKKPNEISMLKANNIPDELKERLGLVMNKLNGGVVSGDMPNRYRQSLNERQTDVQNSLDNLDEETKRLLEQQKEDISPTPSVDE